MAFIIITLYWTLFNAIYRLKQILNIHVLEPRSSLILIGATLRLILITCNTILCNNLLNKLSHCVQKICITVIVSCYSLTQFMYKHVIYIAEIYGKISKDRRGLLITFEGVGINSIPPTNKICSISASVLLKAATPAFSDSCFLTLLLETLNFPFGCHPFHHCFDFIISSTTRYFVCSLLLCFFFTLASWVYFLSPSFVLFLVGRRMAYNFLCFDCHYYNIRWSWRRRVTQQRRLWNTADCEG